VISGLNVNLCPYARKCKFAGFFLPEYQWLSSSTKRPFFYTLLQSDFKTILGASWSSGNSFEKTKFTLKKI